MDGQTEQVAQLLDLATHVHWDAIARRLDMAWLHGGGGARIPANLYAYAVALAALTQLPPSPCDERRVQLANRVTETRGGSVIVEGILHGWAQSPAPTEEEAIDRARLALHALPEVHRAITPPCIVPGCAADGATDGLCVAHLIQAGNTSKSRAAFIARANTIGVAK